MYIQVKHHNAFGIISLSTTRVTEHSIGSRMPEPASFKRICADPSGVELSPSLECWHARPGNDYSNSINQPCKYTFYKRRGLCVWRGMVTPARVTSILPPPSVHAKTYGTLGRQLECRVINRENCCFEAYATLFNQFSLYRPLPSIWYIYQEK